MFTGTVSLVTRAALVVLFFAFPITSDAQLFNQNEDYFIRKGHSYSAGKVVDDTISVFDPITSEETLLSRIDSFLPRYIDGKRVYDLNEVSTPAKIAAGQPSVEEYLFSSLKDYVARYFDGTELISLRIHLKNVIIDEKGKVVFYEQSWTRGGRKGQFESPLVHDKELDSNIGKVFGDMPPMIPATLNGVNATSYIALDLRRYKVTPLAGSIAYTYDGIRYPH